VLGAGANLTDTLVVVEGGGDHGSSHELHKYVISIIWVWILGKSLVSGNW
jgi:hypothetical protein